MTRTHSNQSPDAADAVVAAEYDRLRGRLLGAVESWGLPSLFGDDGQRQERGIKGTIKTLTYESQKRVTELVQD